MSGYGRGPAGDTRITEAGGLTVTLINRTGGATVRGQLVEAHHTLARSFILASSDCHRAIGVVYDEGLPDGAACRVVVSGRCEVKTSMGADCSGAHRMYVSATPGVAECRDADSFAPDVVGQIAENRLEVGHCICDGTRHAHAGTCWIALHL